MLNPASLSITSVAIFFGTHVALAQPIACPEQPSNAPLDQALKSDAGDNRSGHLDGS